MSHASAEWEVVRYDVHGNRFRFRRDLTEAEAKSLAKAKNDPPPGVYKHHQSYEARRYLQLDAEIIE